MHADIMAASQGLSLQSLNVALGHDFERLPATSPQSDPSCPAAAACHPASSFVLVASRSWTAPAAASHVDRLPSVVVEQVS